METFVGLVENVDGGCICIWSICVRVDQIPLGYAAGMPAVVAIEVKDCIQISSENAELSPFNSLKTFDFWFHELFFDSSC